METFANEQHIRSQDASTLASCIRRDQDRCKAGLRPSTLALYLPSERTPLADAIAQCLVEKGHEGSGDVPAVPGSVRRFWYKSIVQGLRDRIKTFAEDEDEHFASQVTSTLASISRSDLETTLKVLYSLKDLADSRVLTATSLSGVVAIIEEQLSNSDGKSQTRQQTPNQSSPGKRRCYICRFFYSAPHERYPSLCYPCGSFNIAQSDLSLPHNLDLRSKTALVTGGRVNLGFQIALRLLRCGARTIVSTRYPLDAETRYRAEHDFNHWSDRLRIIGADFRTAKDVFRLVANCKTVLMEWNETDGVSKDGRLFVLVNNAAQTLTDSLESESDALDSERNLGAQIGVGELQVESDDKYTARIRGGVVRPMLDIDESPTRQRTYDDKSSALVGGVQPKSSWLQTLGEIPYEDVISAHSVNAFAPLILCRELLPIMGSEVPPAPFTANATSKKRGPVIFVDDPDTPESDKPLGYIVNVSSREGIFESSVGSSAKSGMHVHTNMSKAALNMVTETEAASAWKTRCVAMNTVDPGYMSAIPEFEAQHGPCPIGFDDGAARVLWPVAVGETNAGTARVWGRFLKHFGKVEVKVGLGR